MGLSHMSILIWAAHTHMGSPYAYGIASFFASASLAIARIWRVISVKNISDWFSSSIRAQIHRHRSGGVISSCARG